MTAYSSRQKKITDIAESKQKNLFFLVTYQAKFLYAEKSKLIKKHVQITW